MKPNRITRSPSREELLERINQHGFWVMAGTGLLLGMLMIWLIMAIYYRYPVICEFIAAAGWVPIYFIAYLVGYKYKAIMIAKIMGESER